MWARLGREPTVARTTWPVVDERLVTEQSVTAVVQVNGKVRARVQVTPDVVPSELESVARESCAAFLEGQPVTRVIVRAPALVNFVTMSA